MPLPLPSDVGPPSSLWGVGCLCWVIIVGWSCSVATSFPLSWLCTLVSWSLMDTGVHCCHHWLLAPTIHHVSSGSQGWGWVLGCPLSLWGAGAGVELFLVIVGPWCMVSSEEAGYPMLLLGMGCVLTGAVIAAHLQPKTNENS